MFFCVYSFFMLTKTLWQLRKHCTKGGSTPRKKAATPPTFHVALKTLTFNPDADAVWQQMHLSILKFMEKIAKIIAILGKFFSQRFFSIFCAHVCVCECLRSLPFHYKFLYKIFEYIWVWVYTRALSHSQLSKLNRLLSWRDERLTRPTDLTDPGHGSDVA